MQAICSTTQRSGAPALFMRHWPLEKARAGVLLIHGFGEHSGRYSHVAEALGERGVETWATDLRGFGESHGRRACIGNFEDYLDDEAFAIEPVAQQREPLFLLGHSMGGLVCAQFALKRRAPLTGLILSSPALAFALKVPAWKSSAAALASRWLPNLRMPSGVNPKLLSHDPQVAKGIAKDPLAVWMASARWYTECLAAQAEAQAAAPSLELPLLSLAAGADAICDEAAAKRFHQAAGSTDKSWISYPGLYHEIFNEIGRAAVLRDLGEWIEDHSEPV